MSGIIEFFSYSYVTELAGIDTGEKCLGPGTWHGTKGGIWEVGCDYGVTLGKSGAGFVTAAKTGDWRQDPCVFYCGIWKRIRRLIGKFKVRGKFDYHIPTAIVAVRGTTFMVDVTDDGTTLVAVLEGTIEIVDRISMQSMVIQKGQQITVVPKKPLTEPCLASKDLLGEIKKWRENVVDKGDIEELKMPKNTLIELPRGRLNYASLGAKKEVRLC